MSKDYFLTHEEEAVLHPDALNDYLRAKGFCQNEHAGGFDGWSAGHERLMALGWEKKERRDGHRVFVSLVKPDSIQHLIHNLTQKEYAEGMDALSDIQNNMQH